MTNQMDRERPHTSNSRPQPRANYLAGDAKSVLTELASRLSGMLNPIARALYTEKACQFALGPSKSDCVAAGTKYCYRSIEDPANYSLTKSGLVLLSSTAR